MLTMHYDCLIFEVDVDDARLLRRDGWPAESFVRHARVNWQGGQSGDCARRSLVVYARRRSHEQPPPAGDTPPTKTGRKRDHNLLLVPSRVAPEAVQNSQDHDRYPQSRRSPDTIVETRVLPLFTHRLTDCLERRRSSHDILFRQSPDDFVVVRLRLIPRPRNPPTYQISMRC